MQIKVEKKSYSFNNLSKLQGKKYSYYKFSAISPRFTAINILYILIYSSYVWSVKLVACTQSLFQIQTTKESFWSMNQFIMWFSTTDQNRKKLSKFSYMISLSTHLLPHEFIYKSKQPISSVACRVKLFNSFKSLWSVVDQRLSMFKINCHIGLCGRLWTQGNSRHKNSKYRLKF